MADESLIAVKALERGYYAGLWFDTAGVKVVQNNIRVQKALARNPDFVLAAPSEVPEENRGDTIDRSKLIYLFSDQPTDTDDDVEFASVTAGAVYANTLHFADGSSWNEFEPGAVVTPTASGDGSTLTFSLAHPLESTPRVANVTPTSEDASTDFWVSDRTDSAVEITYAAAPSAGADNLTYTLEVR